MVQLLQFWMLISGATLFDTLFPAKGKNHGLLIILNELFGYSKAPWNIMLIIWNATHYLL